jgi:5-methylcytosine-specific restriction endonuclease McrA
MEEFICNCHNRNYANKHSLAKHIRCEKDPEYKNKLLKKEKEYKSREEYKKSQREYHKKRHADPIIQAKDNERGRKYKQTPEGRKGRKRWNNNRKTSNKGFSELTKDKLNNVYNKWIDSEGKLFCCLCFEQILYKEDALEHLIPIARYQEFSGLDLNAEWNLGPAHHKNSIQKCNNKKYKKTVWEWFQTYPNLILTEENKMTVHKMFESIRKSIYENEEVVPAEISEKPEITPELVDELIEGTGIEDKEQFEKGLQEELEHYDSVNKDLNILASIVVDHLKETPNYYSIIEKALADAKEQPKEEVAEEPVAEPVVEEPVVENKPIDSKVAPAAITSENKVKESVSSEIEDDPKYLDLSEKENVSILDAISSISDFAIVGSFNDEDNGFDYITLWVSFKDNTGKEVFFKSNTIGSSVYTDWLDGLPKGKLSSKVTVDVKNILCDRETKYHSFDVGYAEDEEDVEEGKHNPTKLDDSEEALKALYEQLDHAKKVRDMKKVQEITAKVEELKNKITKGKLSETIGKEQATLTFAFGKKIDPNKYLSNIVAKLQEEYPSANVELSEFTEKIILSNGSAKAYQIVVLSDEPLENLKYFTDMYLEKIQFSKV